MSNPKVVERMLVDGSRKLYIFFGGVLGGIAILPFEFYKASNILNENKIFVRDVEQCWYHKGLLGISHDLQTTALFLKSEIDRLNVEEVYFVGNSMGGYAAILFSTLVGRGEVIAFAPQTFISPELRQKYSDARWSRQMLKTHDVPTEKAFDLRTLLLSSELIPRISIFVSRDDVLDCIHANHIRNIPNLDIYYFSGGGHAIIKQLKEEGKLADILSGNYLKNNRP